MLANYSEMLIMLILHILKNLLKIIMILYTINLHNYYCDYCEEYERPTIKVRRMMGAGGGRRWAVPGAGFLKL